MKKALIVFLIFFPLNVFAAGTCGSGSKTGTTPFTADSTSQANVTACLDGGAYSISAGETLLLPTGDSTWSSLVSVGLSNITIQGDGTSNTTIRNYGFTITSSADNIEISGINFYVASASYGNGYESVHVTTGSTGIYIHSNIFNGAFHCITFDNGAKGVIANNIIQSSEIEIDGDGTEHSTDNALGGSPFVFVEDNLFEHGQYAENHRIIAGAPDGTRMVIRCNKFTNASGSALNDLIDAHDFGVGSNRGMREAEIYGNAISLGSNLGTFVDFRSGTGVIHHNQLTTNGYAAKAPNRGGTLNLLVERYRDACNMSGDFLYPPNGSPNLCTSVDSGNRGAYCQATEGYPCCDQIGRGKDIAAASSQPFQESEPLYMWSNTTDGGSMSVGTCFDNTIAALTDGTDYFSSTQAPGYIPYQYPHDLRGISQTGTCLVGSNSEADTGITFVDTTEPAVLTASINATSFSVTFDEDLDNTALGNLINGDLVVTGSVTGAVDLESCSESPAGTLNCTAASSMQSNESVTLSSSGLTGDELCDASANCIASISGESITNNTPAAQGSGSNTGVYNASGGRPIVYNANGTAIGLD